MATLAIWITVLMLFGSCIGTSPLQGIQQLWQDLKKWTGCPFPLDMAKNSVDDIYDGCEEDMKTQVDNLFLQIEKKKSEKFSLAWDAAEKYYNMKWARTRMLTKEQIMALYAYTLETPELYPEFNKAVREQKSKYKTTFSNHTLHFYLTMALRSLKRTAVGCVTTYRGTDCKFKTAIKNKEIRFGAFTSSSVYRNVITQFGAKSCFIITTCFGADISKFSKYEKEGEVLIPPYEVFKVTDIKKRSAENSLPCEVVYKLESTKETCSNLNCALFGEKGFQRVNVCVNG